MGSLISLLMNPVKRYITIVIDYILNRFNKIQKPPRNYVPLDLIASIQTLQSLSITQLQKKKLIAIWTANRMA